MEQLAFEVFEIGMIRILDKAIRDCHKIEVEKIHTTNWKLYTSHSRLDGMLYLLVITVWKITELGGVELLKDPSVKRLAVFGDTLIGETIRHNMRKYELSLIKCPHLFDSGACLLKLTNSNQTSRQTLYELVYIIFHINDCINLMVIVFGTLDVEYQHWYSMKKVVDTLLN
ncbi:hypothetical protein BC833DRAFT_658356 [Globomyces pollinis-pini]|nr:hypothetical protein BC833DRAFT_658356 [Globomyces pollinis-pini]